MMWATKNKRLVLQITRDDREAWRQRVTARSQAAWDAWDRRCRNALGWRNGLRVSRNNQREWMLSRHWEHRLCWDWFFSVGWWPAGSQGSFGVKLLLDGRLHQVSLCLLWLVVRFHWQDSAWMAAGAYRGSAPRLIWKHHLAHMRPAGAA